MTDHITSADQESIDLLQRALDRLLQAEKAIGELIDSTPDGFIAWGDPLRNIATAIDTLRGIPQLFLISTQPAETACPDITPESLLEEATEIYRMLVAAAVKATDRQRKRDCLHAAAFVEFFRGSLEFR